MRRSDNSIQVILAAGVLAVAAVFGSTGPRLVCAEETPAPGLTVHVDQPGIKISPMLYGIFFEEINLAGDGGLYAELVRNRSFEDSDKPEYWSVVCNGRSKASMALDATQPVSEKNLHSLRIDLQPAKDGRAGVANEGYFGINVRKDVKYECSFYARGEGFSGPLTVTLENVVGDVFASATIEKIGGEWQQYAVTLKANANDPKGRLVIATDRPGTLWLDVVSLFPPTWKGRANGLRPDLAEMLLGLKPAFMRFPGGCWVEGDTMATASRWKRTIGPIGDRFSQPNLWGYQSTNGLGYHEYLQLCEDLGAEPLFVINCGMSHKQNVPMDQMDEFVQDALDAIEYANGPADSKWGAVRAKAGHPEAFNMKYMEIGNENGGPEYDKRYALFHDAIKAKYPQMNLVACVWNGTPKSRPLEIVDEHYYNTPEFFMQNAHKYDGYKRDGHKVYVGEYAVTQNAGLGHLRAALGEAAFMMGMERNSDVVVMSSYAPLFVHANHRRWNPDLIVFDSARVYGIPSYYVQQMFSRNRGDVVLPVDAVPQVVPEDPALGQRGAVGVGSWLTQVEYKDLKVVQDGKTLYEFSGDRKGWRFKHGDWKVQDGVLRQQSDDENCRGTVGDAKWTDYTYSLKARKTGGKEGFLILFRAENDGNWIWWNIGGWGNSRSALERSFGGGHSELGTSVPGGIETGRWYDLRVEVKGRNIKCFLDGKLSIEANDTPKEVNPVYATASWDEKSSEVIVKVVNVSRAEQKLPVELKGVGQVDVTGTAIILTGAPEGENSLDAREVISPVTEPVTNAGATFQYTFPANSLTVLRLKVKK